MAVLSQADLWTGFNVTPYGSTESPGTPHGYGRGRGRGAGAGGSGGSYTPRGRGRGGGLGFNADRLHTPQSTSAQDSPGASGSATPVTGIGYKGKGKSALPGAADMGTSGAPPGRMTSTVGRGIGTGDVTWGGRKGAPMFIKAGELFKDGEVDLVTGDQGKLTLASWCPTSSSVYCWGMLSDFLRNSEVQITIQLHLAVSVLLEGDFGQLTRECMLMTIR